ncbi:basal body-orientation factor 1-like isoform X2 [Watersipora subatra]|uniref:basal body-orientation factor 1-like isoform X2 n=1 Tax=Watersipora subatra TaxID=2589382 RepID=UPI00355C558B
MAKKGKKSGKKGKKGGKKGKKPESAAKQATANEKVWQARLRTVEKTKEDFKDNAQRLAAHNDALQGQMRQVELDTLDVITFLKGQDSKKDGVVYKLESELKKCLEQNEQEKKTLITDYTEQIDSLKTQIGKRQDDIVLMQNELKHVKEFRKKRVAMQRELDEIKDAMFLADREHKAETGRMTQKFEDEKVAMQQDTNHKISELADRAHQEAITNLDETTRSVYKENVRLTEALRFHKKEGDNYRKTNQELEAGILQLRQKQEETEMNVQEKVSSSQKQRQQITKAEEKITALEEAINNMSVKFDSDQQHIHKMSALESASSGVEIAKLERLLQLKSQECAKVRKLSRGILSQRTDIEQHFLHCLDQAKEDYAFHKEINKKHVTVSDLSWDAREAVLRSLFVKMNNDNKRNHQPVGEADRAYLLEDSYVPMSQEEARLIRDEIQGDDKDLTFLTQADLADLADLNGAQLL